MAALLEDREVHPGLTKTADDDVVKKFEVFLLLDPKGCERVPAKLEIGGGRILLGGDMETPIQSLRYSSRVHCQQEVGADLKCLLVSCQLKHTVRNVIIHPKNIGEMDEIHHELNACVLSKFRDVDMTMEDRVRCQTLLEEQPLYSDWKHVQVKEGQQTVADKDFYMVLDRECMCLYGATLQEEPLYLVKFWEDPASDVVERVLMNHMQRNISFETGNRTFQVTALQSFADLMKKIRPMGKHLLTEPKTLLLYAKLNDAPSRQPPSGSSWQQLQGRYHASGSSETVAAGALADRLNNALKTFESNEDFQAVWIANQCDIEDLLTSGTVPESDFTSGGMSENNVEHLERSFSDIQNLVSEGDLRMAVSRLQACRKFFGASTVSGVSSLFLDSDEELLKKLYFLSLCS